MPITGVFWGVKDVGGQTKVGYVHVGNFTQ